MFLVTQAVIALVVTVIMYYIAKKDYAWWEYGIQFLIPFLIVLGVKELSLTYMSSDTEFWTTTLKEMVYQEQYRIWVTKTCSETYACGSDSNGNTKYCTRYYDCSECESRGPYYYLNGQSASYVGIDTWNYLKKKWKVKPEHIGTNGDHCGKGDRWRIQWDQSYETHQAWTSVHPYENKIRYDAGRFPMRELTETEKSIVKSYPDLFVGIEQKPISGPWRDAKDLNNANHRLNYFNAVYGPKSREEHGQIKVFIMLYKDVPKSKVHHAQRIKLEYGNKNEFIVMLGWNSNTNSITWSDVITHTVDGTSVNTPQRIINDNPDISMEDFVIELTEVLSKNWIRTEFTPLNDVITLKPKLWVWIVALVLQGFIGFAVAAWNIANEFDRDY